VLFLLAKLMIIMNTNEPEFNNEAKIEYTYIQCCNCSGYGTKGFNRIVCPSCKGTGVLRVPVKEKEESK